MVEQAIEAGARQRPVCRLIGLSERTLERWRQRPDGDDERCGPRSKPSNQLSDQERTRVLEVVNSKAYRDLSPHQIVPRLADEGKYLCSEATIFRLLRHEKQLAHRGKSRPPTPAIPEERVASGPNQVWSWDISYLKSPVAGMFYYLYLVVDIWSRKIVGWRVHESESMELAAELIDDAARREGVPTASLTLHSDNGGPMTGATLLATLDRLGIMASFSRPGVCDDNPFSEALFRTIKYRPEYPDKPFESLHMAHRWVGWFVAWYHGQHLHSGICYVSPLDRHAGSDGAILRQRHAVYEAARQRRPERWARGRTRCWTPPPTVRVRARRNTAKDEQRNSLTAGAAGPSRAVTR